MRNKIVLISVIFTIMLLTLNNCSILSERWTITWDNISAGGAAANNHLEIDNKTTETISSVKYIVSSNPPSDSEWTNAISIGTIPAYSGALYSIGTSGQDISIPNPSDHIIWIKVAANAYGQSQLFAQSSFLYEAGGEQKWVATIWKDSANK
jgi:hypothetical protein